MSASPTTRRAIAEIDFGEGQGALFKIGNHSIHQFWHLFSSHFRNVLLAPQRRPDSGRVAWTWRESSEKRPVTATELAEVRRRLTEAGRSLAGSFGGLDRGDDGPGGSSTLEAQVRASVGEMIGQLIDQRDSALNGFVCRTDAGLMVHSWGASIAADPYYPDAQQGEISGALFAGAERIAGASVVLENAQGAGVARVKSERDGNFRFPNVSPGNYRIRVIDRSDFPGGGLAVSMERESITGLELRGTSAESVSTSAIPPPPTEDAPPWYKRRWIAVIALFLVVGMGSCIWRSTHSPAVQAAADNKSSGWQSAKGQLAGEEAKNSSRDDRKVGTEGAFSSLSNSLPAPKPLSPSPAWNQSKGKTPAIDRAPFQIEDSSASRAPASEGKNSNPDFASKSNPGAAVPALNKPPESRSPSSPNSTGNPQSSEDHPAMADEGDEPESATDKLAKSSGKGADKKRPAALGSSSPTVDESPDKSLSPAGQSAPADSSTSAPDGAPGSNSTKAPTAKSPSGNGKTSSAPEVGGDAESPAQDSPASAANSTSAGQLKPNPGRKSGENAKDANPDVASGVSAESGASVAEGEVAAESSATEPSTDKDATKSARPKKTSPGKTAAQPEAAQKPDQENPGNAADPDAPSSLKKIVKQSPNAAGETSTTVKSAEGSSPSAVENNSDESVAEKMADTASNASPAVRKKSSRKAGSSSSSKAEGEEEAAASSLLPLAIVSKASGDRLAAVDYAPLVAIGRIHASSWKPRLVQDLIVPTRPVTAAEEDALEMMREKLLRDRTARMPKTFQQPKAKSGLVFEFRGGKENPLQWKNDRGTEPAGSSVNEHSAQLEWTGGMPLPNTNYVLSDSTGRQLVQVGVDQTGTFVLKATPGVRVSYWMGIESAPAGEAEASAGRSGDGFEWRLLSGASIPASWSRDDRWLDGRGRRIAVPLDDTTRRVGNYSIALVDPATGWAIVSDVAARAP